MDRWMDGWDVLWIYRFSHPIIHLFILASIYPFICPSIHLPIHSFTHLLIHPCIYVCRSSIVSLTIKRSNTSGYSYQMGHQWCGTCCTVSTLISIHLFNYTFLSSSSISWSSSLLSSKIIIIYHRYHHHLHHHYHHHLYYDITSRW